MNDKLTCHICYKRAPEHSNWCPWFDVLITLSDPSLAKSDSEAIYLFYLRQYQLNEQWIRDLIDDLYFMRKTLSHVKQEIDIHLKNLKNLNPVIVTYEEGIKSIKE